MICPRCGAPVDQMQDKRYSCTDDDCTLFSFRVNRRGAVYDERESGLAWIHTEGNLSQINPK